MNVTVDMCYSKMTNSCLDVDLLQHYLTSGEPSSSTSSIFHHPGNKEILHSNVLCHTTWLLESHHHLHHLYFTTQITAMCSASPPGFWRAIIIHIIYISPARYNKEILHSNVLQHTTWLLESHNHLQHLYFTSQIAKKYCTAMCSNTPPGFWRAQL